jgi:hypothetical protein
MTDDDLIAAAFPLLRQLLERDLIRARTDRNGDTFTLLFAAPTDKDLAEQLRSLPPLPPIPRITDTTH